MKILDFIAMLVCYIRQNNFAIILFQIIIFLDFSTQGGGQQSNYAGCGALMEKSTHSLIFLSEIKPISTYL